MKPLMVCISTNQEIANLLPALWCDASGVISMVTSYARGKGWPSNLERALEGMSLFVEELDGEAEVSPARVRELIEEAVRRYRVDEAQPVVFAWGGGQKPQGAGVWLAFVSLYAREPQAGHRAVYVEQNNKRLLRWDSPDEAPVIEGLEPTLALSLERVLATSGLKVIDEASCIKLSPHRDELDPAWGEVYELYQRNQAFRELCFRYGAGDVEDADLLDELPKQALSDWLDAKFSATLSAAKLESRFSSFMVGWPKVMIAEHVRKPTYVKNMIVSVRKYIKDELKRADEPVTVEIPADEEVRAYLERVNGRPIEAREVRYGFLLAPEVNRFSMLFEKMIAWRVASWLDQGTSARVYDVRVNMKYTHQQDAPDYAIGELDVVVLTRSGVVVALDAKTFPKDFGKTQRAQEHSVSQVGGSFASRYVVFPMHSADLGKASAEPVNQWGAQPWYPAALLAQISKVERREADAPRLVPFDEGRRFEEALAKVCGVSD
jgi:hypothetical protein